MARGITEQHCACQCEHKHIFRINNTSIPINNDPLTLKLCIKDYITIFELDTGSFVTTIWRVDVIKSGGTIIPMAEKAMAYGGGVPGLVFVVKQNLTLNIITQLNYILS